MIEFFTDYAWIVWIGLILLFVIVEVATVEFTFLMLALGGVGGLLAGFFGAPFWLQVIVGGIVAILLLFAVRPRLLRALKRGGDPAPSNVEALIGIHGTVVIPLVARRGEPGLGQVKLSNGETWTARRLAPDGEENILDTGATVVVTAIEGSTAVVVPAERTQP